ncbi:MAG TPA: hypothetical protein VEL11_09715 [Candidatus Bathyarchaeia archaeon]|nr:hypothetical protein [Candidatus Bathyarchaeia archaeon]
MTGPRRAPPLIDSLPALMDWLEIHPQRHNKKAILFCSYKTGGKLYPDSVNNRYQVYRKRLIKLYESREQKLPEQDRIAVGRLIKKPFNQYTQRHSATTEHSGILSDAYSCDAFGWKPGLENVTKI